MNVMYEKYLNKESRDILSLIALKLDNLSPLRKFYEVRHLNTKLTERRLYWNGNKYSASLLRSPDPAPGLAQQYHCSKTPF